MILGLVDEAVAADARQSKACDLINMETRTLQRWRSQDIGDDGRAGPKRSPANKLTAKERARILELVNSPEYRDLSPKQIVARLADVGEFIASESTIYRMLREEKQMRHRESSRPPSKPYRLQEYVARGPNQVWSWDITYLQTPVRGLLFYLYVVMDIWSRKIVAWTIEGEETGELAPALVAAACKREGVLCDQLVIHSDNGSPMKAATLLAFLQGISVVPSFNRPRVSNDNPYSESLFRTTKDRPQYPRKPFESIEKARNWMTWFVGWCNGEHRRSGIKFVTPEQRHNGEDIEILAKRVTLYKKARAQHPNRWTKVTRDWNQVEVVVLNPAQCVTERDSGAA